MIRPEWKDQVARWASSKPEIAQVYFYGSRVLGTAREDSDLDVAIVLAVDEADEDCFTEVMSLWSDRKAWEAELSCLVGVAVDLECGNRCASPDIVAPAIESHGMRIYPVVD
jgi:predicted nucleotidyltransferase